MVGRHGEEHYSFVNGQHTTQGGTHQAAFREAIVKTLRDCLLYTSDGNRLTLTGKSMGNGNSSLFTATSTIDRRSRNTLILDTDGTRETYTRMPDADGR